MGFIRNIQCPCLLISFIDQESKPVKTITKLQRILQLHEVYQLQMCKTLFGELL